MFQEYPKLRHVWAKSSKTGEDGESLVNHTYQVLSRLSQIAKRLPHLPALVEEPELWNQVFWAAYIHDLGKCAKAFQQVLRGKAPRWIHRHEVLSLAFLPSITKANSEDYRWIVAAIVSHHKDATEISTLYNTYDIDETELSARNMINELDNDDISEILLWLREIPSQWIYSLNIADFHIRISPALSRDITATEFKKEASNTIITALKVFKELVHNLKDENADSLLNRKAIALRGLMTWADHLASAHAKDLETVHYPNIEELSSKIEITPDQLKSHQTGAYKSNGSVILTAPTGSGKTEASILWAKSQQLSMGIPPALIYLLPFQASLNAIRQRLKNLFEVEDVALLHGHGLQVLYKEFSEHNGYPPKDAEAKAKRSKDLGKLHHAQIRCATPYQILRAAYQLPGYENLLVSLAGALIVVDEVHAYETTRLGMFIGLLSYLKKQWGARICCMTATMPSWLRRLIKEEIADFEVSADKNLYSEFQRHRLEIIQGEILSEKVSNLVQEEIKAGKSILLATNVVSTAQKLRDELTKRLSGTQILLLHSRFNARDRLEKERSLQETLKKKVSKEPIVVVATQVIEVSLDLDFDMIISQPAPLEALIQRFGRVNRRGKKGIVPVRVLTDPEDAYKIYSDNSDHRLIDNTLSVLNKINGKVLDELILNSLLDEVYKDGLENEYRGEVFHNIKEFKDNCLEKLRAFHSNRELGKEFDDLFDNVEVLPADLIEEYDKLREESILEANSLLVPVGWKKLRRANCLRKEENKWNLKIVDAPYNSDIGLQL